MSVFLTPSLSIEQESAHRAVNISDAEFPAGVRFGTFGQIRLKPSTHRVFSFTLGSGSRVSQSDTK